MSAAVAMSTRIQMRCPECDESMAIDIRPKACSAHQAHKGSGSFFGRLERSGCFLSMAQDEFICPKCEASIRI
ncbi:hypothetical protein AAVH_21230 [Aphelenchoides avenae]|nr:hypothetical protein AAVH_21230 [Aphelenchus avenae]